MRILITGGAGFLGYHLAARLLADGAEIVLVDNLVRGREDADLAALLERPGVSLLRLDIEDPRNLTQILGAFDEVYHLAAVIGVRHVLRDPARVLRVNARTVLNVLELVEQRQVPRVFFAGTSESYAWTSRLIDLPVPTPEDVPLAIDDINNRRAAYALSKIYGEMVLLHAFAETETKVVSGRFHNVYGPRMGTAHVIPELFLRMLRGETPLRVREAAATRAFCHVDDAVRAMVMLTRTAPAGVYNIGNDAEEIGVGELSRRIATAAGFPVDELEVDYDEVPSIPRRCPDISKIRTIGFEPAVTLAQGLENTLAWYRHSTLPTGI